jgi:trans-2,3-dihydro-3-hydroxyanthranilate isomerase
VVVVAAVLAGRVRVVVATVVDRSWIVGCVAVTFVRAVVGGGGFAECDEEPQPAAESAARARTAVARHRTRGQGTRVEPVPTLRYVVVDVFTDRPLAGNQLAVFTDGREVDDETMQALARELNYSETVFVLPPTEGGHARIRIFTPLTELPFAGHPVLGSAFVLAAPLQLGEIKLEMGAGTVPVVLEREGAKITFGWMSQPIPEWEPFARADEVLSLLGVESALPVEQYHLGPEHVYIALGSDEEVAALAPDFAALARITAAGVNCFAGSGTHWKTRMFAPLHGVPEDPATGSAAGPLAVHLARHGRTAFGDEIEISQGVEIGRPSTLYARAFGEGDRIDRVEVGGSAVVVARGEFRL